jgi:LPPG:FO 2-phospho-L-lactate transferase
MLREGKSLSEVTEWARRQYSIPAKIIPATDKEVATKVITGRGEMHLQEFWVRDRGRPTVTGIRYDGIAKARASRKAIDAISKADMVVIAPANPISSIGPIVALKDLRRELVKKRRRVVAISPLIGEQAVSGPAVKYMKAIGLENSPAGVAKQYRDFAGSIVISTKDHDLAPKIRDLDMRVFETDITMKNRQDEIRLGRYIIDKVMNN